MIRDEQLLDNEQVRNTALHIVRSRRAAKTAAVAAEPRVTLAGLTAKIACATLRQQRIARGLSSYAFLTGEKA